MFVCLLIFIAAVIVLLLLRAESMISSVKTEKEKSRDSYSSERSYSYREEYSYEKSADNERKIEKIINLMVKDFNNSPYRDKFSVSQFSRSWFFIYRFNNGYKITMSDFFIILYNSNEESINSFHINDMQSYQIMRKIKELIERSVNRNHRTYSEYDYQKKYGEYRQEQPKAEPKPETTGNPKLDKILEKIKLRKEQLSKMKSNDPERAALVNELKTYENVANKMKSKAK